MSTRQKHCSVTALNQAIDLEAVLVEARKLKRAVRAGTTQARLRGKKLGLLCEADDAYAALFHSAAVELGAHVSHIRPSLRELSTPQEVQRTSRVLGRLYDAVECQGMSPALVEQIGNDAEIPVYDGLASPQHATARLAEQLGNDMAPEANRRLVLQAVLVRALA